MALEAKTESGLQRARELSEQAAEFRRQNRPQEALSTALEAIAICAQLPEPWECAASILIFHKRWAEACRLLKLGIEANPGAALLHAQYALALVKCGNPTDAFAMANRSLGLQPGLPQAVIARIEALSEAGHYDLALADSLALKDENGPGAAALARGSLAFMTGDVEQGMNLLATVLDTGWADKGLPKWDGKANPAAHLVVYGTQAYGDRIHFARYVDAIRSRVGKITLNVPRALTRLMRDSFPDISLAIGEEEAGQNDVPIAPGTQIGLPKDSNAVFCTFAELSLYAQDPFSPFADKVPYLRADPQLSAVWREGLASLSRPRIGVNWAPGTWYSSDPLRSLSFEILKPLIELAGPHIVSLQLGPEARLAAESGLFDASPTIRDFADSAALLKEIDLLITFDSGTAHLAGALGVPVWVLLPFNADWRWLISREDSIWYPSMRLFRMNAPGDWESVIKNVAASLKQFLAGDTSVLAPAKWTTAALRRHSGAIILPGLKEAPD